MEYTLDTPETKVNLAITPVFARTADDLARRIILQETKINDLRADIYVVQIACGDFKEMTTRSSYEITTEGRCLARNLIQLKDSFMAKASPALSFEMHSQIEAAKEHAEKQQHKIADLIEKLAEEDMRERRTPEKSVRFVRMID